MPDKKCCGLGSTYQDVLWIFGLSTMINAKNFQNSTMGRRNCRSRKLVVGRNRMRPSGSDTGEGIPKPQLCANAHKDLESSQFRPKRPSNKSCFHPETPLL